MKIALVGRYGEGEIISGPERVARELFAELNRKNIEVVFLEYYFSGYNNSSIIKKIFGKEFFNNHSIHRLGIIPLLLTLKRNKFEIIHIVNSQRFVLFLLWLKPFIKGKILTTLHGSMAKEVPRSKIFHKRFFIDLWVEKLAVKKSSLLIFPSNILFDFFYKHYKISNNKCQIIPNGVSKTFNIAESSFQPVDSAIKIVFYNGFDNSINRGLTELLKLLGNTNHKIELFVIGDRTEQSNFSNIELIFTGLMSHPELIKFLQDKHFIIKSSSFDSFSIMIAECMTLGLIPLIQENIGIKDFILNKVNGFIYSNKSGEGLTYLIDDILTNKYDLELISKNAKKIYDQLNWNIITESYIASYKSIV